MANMKTMLLAVLSTLSSIALTEKMELSHNLGAQANICFLEHIGESVQAIAEVESDSRDLTLTVTDPKGKKLATQSGEEKLRYHFAAFTGGNYQMCIQNMKPVQTVFKFTIQTGVQATDYSNIVTKKHLRPVELQAQKISDMIDQLRTELGLLIVSEEELKEENQKIKSRVVIFGVVSIIVMALSTYLQVVYLKNFFRYKKII